MSQVYRLITIAVVLSFAIGCGDSGTIEPSVQMVAGTNTVYLAPTLDLAVSDLIAGEDATVAVASSASSKTVYIIMARGGEGEGPCPPDAGGTCFDLTPPLKHAVTIELDSDGNGSGVFPINENTPGGMELAFQAIIVDGPDSVTSSVVIRTVMGVENPLICAVGGEYVTINEAVAANPTGGIFSLCPQVYEEDVTISSGDFRFIGEDANTTTIKGSGTTSVLEVSPETNLGVVGVTITGGSASFGGGIYCDHGSIRAADVIVSDNLASTDGGGVYGNQCDFLLSNIAVTNNSATFDGGGIRLNNTTATIVRTDISNNTAREGGGLYADENGIDKTLFISNSTFSHNTALTDDDHDDDGVDDDRWGTGGGGGALWLALDDATVSHSSFDNNESHFNGGAIFLYGDSVQLSHNEVTSNLSHEDGGAVFSNYGNHTIDNNAFDSNVAYDDGGGLRLYHGGSDVYDNTFSDNVATDDGGGAKLSHSSSHDFYNNILTNNSTGDAGGGLELDNDNSAVYDCEFAGNSASRGGGLHLWRNEGNHTIERLVFDGNSASSCGGAIQIDNNPYRLRLLNSVFTDNSATRGGALCTSIVYRDPDDVGGIKDYYEKSDLRVFNSLFEGNVAYEGGVFYSEAANFEVTNIVAANNGADDGSFFTVDDESEITVINAIVVDGEGDSIIEIDGSGAVTVSYSDFYNNQGGYDGLSNPVGSDGNINENPLFLADYHLNDVSAVNLVPTTSPCVDAGDPAIEDQNGTRSDMGMYGGPYGE